MKPSPGIVRTACCLAPGDIDITQLNNYRSNESKIS